MTKTIKEMADFEYKGYGTIPTRAALRKEYIKGANYVLDEIEKALDTALDTLSVKDGYTAAREVIKQLKGE